MNPVASFERAAQRRQEELAEREELRQVVANLVRFLAEPEDTANFAAWTEREDRRTALIARAKAALGVGR